MSACPTYKKILIILWAGKLELSLNISKCHSMAYSQIHNHLVFNYLIDS